MYFVIQLSLPTAGLPVMPNGRDEGIADMETGSDSASSTAGIKHFDYATYSVILLN